MVYTRLVVVMVVLVVGVVVVVLVATENIPLGGRGS